MLHLEAITPLQIFPGLINQINHSKCANISNLYFMFGCMQAFSKSGHLCAVSTETKCHFNVKMCFICIHTGIVIVGEDAVGHFDLGIFVASIVPNGPADRDGRIRAGK